MGRSLEVPITPSVLKWAINETAKPSLTEFKVVARKLHRQLATFLLPAPPAGLTPVPQFRHPLSSHRRSLNPVERRFIRRAHRLQDAHAWLSRELGLEQPDFVTGTAAEPATDAAARLRARLPITLEQQTNWKSASVAFDARA